MEANDSVLDTAPSSVRPILVLIINAVVPLISAAVKAVHNLDQTIAALVASAPRPTREVSDVVDDVFQDSVNMVTDHVETEPDNPSGHDYLRGYFHASLPKRFANLFSDKEGAQILEQS